jgi:hypothetical protein
MKIQQARDPLRLLVRFAKLLGLRRRCQVDGRQMATMRGVRFLRQRVNRDRVGVPSDKFQPLGLF